ncbi:CPBP family intramembrane glutamic endopeptidase [Paenibacillus sp. NPDC058071]|uniref:CPBP family intramembrane glutamic endopeptidase n=1 Tax=Paenibacillus sp. NPDC058071 TaxID=3346326 RepID=UPI0036D99913
MKTFWSVTGKIVLSFAIVFLLMIIVGAVYGIVSAVSGVNPAEAAASAESAEWLKYVQFILFIGTAYAMFAFFERKKGWSIGMRQHKAISFGVQGTVAGIVLISLSGLVIWALGGISWSASEWNSELVAGLLKGLLLFVGVALSEEIFSRGYVQGLLKFHYGSTVAIVVSSILFTLMHSLNSGMFESPFPFINIVLAGVIMAVAREWTGGLWWPIGLHLTWNYFQGHVFGFNVSGTSDMPSILHSTDNGPSWLSGGAFGAEGSLISVIVLIIGITAVYFIYKRRPKAPSFTSTP